MDTEQGALCCHDQLNLAAVENLNPVHREMGIPNQYCEKEKREGGEKERQTDGGGTQRERERERERD